MTWLKSLKALTNGLVHAGAVRPSGWGPRNLLSIFDLSCICGPILVGRKWRDHRTTLTVTLRDPLSCRFVNSKLTCSVAEVVVRNLR